MISITETDTSEAKVNREKENSNQIIYFLICKACFWCASSFLLEDYKSSKCPVCDTGIVRSMPILS